MTTDYRDTIRLPETAFPMRGNLPEREPVILDRWQQMDLYGRLRQLSAGREPFILHDGPPYANGHLHIGHALNKILKDVINRSQQMLGKDANYVPGWDCHGLPIEWKIEEQYRAAGKDKDAVAVNDFRRECREFAEHWVKVQTEEFQRLGVEGDWKRPYTTMAFSAEAQIAREIAKFAMNGGLYRGSKPVLWSVVEKTALADAEVEYHDHTSHTIHVRFPVVKSSLPELTGASVVIWTTTPWTMPGNRAIAFAEGVEYAVVQITDLAHGSRARVGEKIVIAHSLIEQVMKEAHVDGYSELARMPGSALAGTVCHHPLQGHGYDFAVPLLPGAFVTTDQGTGFVHIAPGHGADDFELGLAHGIQIPQTVAEDGAFYDHVPMFAGKRVYTTEGKMGDANNAVRDALNEAGGLFAFGQLRHSYPHSWRSKAPLIFRNTPQWFISMETNDLRKKALAAIDQTRFVPPGGQNRLRSMIEQRPDWCISRQRVWGVPIALFTHKATGEILKDQAVFDRIAEIFAAEGADAWFSSTPARFLGTAYDPAEWDQVRDIVEVWFESGSTHNFVLDAREDLRWPASLYLEGSDQHRGWFHSSLLESCGTRGRAPYDAVLTHGFVLDEQGRKMSKSLGNVTAPQEVIADFGADILRLWVVASDYSDDLRIGPEIVKQLTDIYRRFRNTFRFLLGNLHGFTEAERVAPEEMPELERWILHRLAELDGTVRQSVADFDFHQIYEVLHNFCAVDLSSLYFDIRKDALYCDAPEDVRRRACRTVLDHVFRCLVTWLGPILCFTTEEAWLARLSNHPDFLKQNPDASVHLEVFPEIPASWRNDRLAKKWETVRAVRRVVTGALEIARRDKVIGSSLQAAPIVFATPEIRALLHDVPLPEIVIASAVTLRDWDDNRPEGAFRLDDVAEVAVAFAAAPGEKCERCWQVLPEVAEADAAKPAGLCRRCAGAVAKAAA